jgi:hypothetical protein
MKMLGTAVICALAAGVVAPAAQAQDDDDAAAAGDGEAAPAGEAEAAPAVTASASAVKWGVGLRVRQVFFPEGMLELFLEDAPSGVGHPGFGLEAVRRKANFDIVLALDYSSITPEDGLYVEKGDTPGQPGEDPDLVEFDGLALLGLDVSFIWHAALGEKFAFRYGAGLGIAAVLGKFYQTDTECSSMQLDSCDPITSGGQVHEEQEDVPPVVPLVNILVGARYQPTPELSFHLDAGFRDLFYVGIGGGYFF